MIALTSPFSFRLIFSFHLRRAAVEGPSPWPWEYAVVAQLVERTGFLTRWDYAGPIPANGPRAVNLSQQFEDAGIVRPARQPGQVVTG